MAIITFGGNTGDTAGLVDTFLRSTNPNTAYGTHSSAGLSITKYGTTTTWMLTLIGVDQAALTAGIPAGSTINSVTLRIYQEASGPGGSASHNFEARRLLRNWLETEATYNVYSTGNAWGTAGGLLDDVDRVAAVSASLASDLTNGVYKEWTDAQLTQDYQDFLDGVVSNYGHHLEYDFAGSSIYHDFRSEEQGADGTRPQIAIDYTAPVAGDTTPPVFTAGPTATNQTTSGHDITATLDEDGPIYAVRLADGATAPSSTQVKAGQDSTGSAALEAKSVAATAGVPASMTFSTGDSGTAYDYYVVAEDDEATPNLQAAPTLVEATTAEVVVPPSEPYWSHIPAAGTLMRHPLSASVLNPAEFTVYAVLQSSAAQAALTATAEGLISLTDAEDEFLYMDDSGLHVTDGTNTASVDPDFSADTDIAIAILGSEANGLRLGYYDAGWVWDASSADYSPVTLGDWINLFYNNPRAMQITTLEVLNDDAGETHIEANYP